MGRAIEVKPEPGLAPEPPSPRRAALEHLAESFGVMPQYLDGTVVRRASDDGLARVLAALAGEHIAIDPGVASGASLEAAVRERLAALRRRWLEPVTVSWLDEPAAIPVIDIDSAPRALRLTLSMEEGAEHTQDVDLNACARITRVLRDGEDGHLFLVPLPPDLPMGYHRATIEWGDRTASTVVLRAPRRSYRPPEASGRASFGVFAPTYALRSERDTGMGDLTDLRSLAALVFERGGSMLGTLPLVATCLDGPLFDPSPYAPISRRFFNKLLIDPERTDEWGACEAARALMDSPEWRAERDRLRSSDLVDYAAQRDLRRPVLRALAHHFLTTGGADSEPFRDYVASVPDLWDYARFRVKLAHEGTGWPAWTDTRVDDIPLDHPDVRMHAYGQYAFGAQLDAMRHEFAEAGGFMYLDFPLGVMAGGYDTWRHKDAFQLDLTVGAPPDAVFDHGQLWGFPPVHPERIREQGYALLRESVRPFMQAADCLRLDHVMGMHRLYLTVDGMSARDGVYARYDSEEQHAVLNIESVRHRCQLVGENLGMVPPEVNEALDEHRYSSMYVAQIFTKPKPATAFDEIPRTCVASLNTHDMPPFAAWWEGKDIADLLALGLVAPADEAKKDRERAKLTEAVGRFLAKRGLLDTMGPLDANAVMHAATLYLAASDAEILLINAEDLWGEREWQNVPGTSTEHPNWRRRWSTTIEAMRADPSIADLLDQVRDARTGALAELADAED
ncbi:MAG: 4-alpha-glucanotransferase [Planctomycetota bacterium]